MTRKPFIVALLAVFALSVVAAPVAAKPLTAREKLVRALRKDAIKIVKISVGGSITVIVKTPTGGFQGPSTGDLNDDARKTFTAIYRSGYHNPSVVVFRGGLVDGRTGADLPNANTGIFSMSRRQAAAIRWKDDDRLLSIDWTYYRDFAHRALKQDD